MMPTPHVEDWRDKWEPLRKDAQGKVIVPTQQSITRQLDILDAIRQLRVDCDEVNRMDPRR